MICEVSAGLAAAVKKGDVSVSYSVTSDDMQCGFYLSPQLETVFTQSANSTFLLYNNETDKQEAWNSFQIAVSAIVITRLVWGGGVKIFTGGGGQTHV